MDRKNEQITGAADGKCQWATPTIRDWDIKEVTLSGITGVGVDNVMYS